MADDWHARLDELRAKHGRLPPAPPGRCNHINLAGETCNQPEDFWMHEPQVGVCAGGVPGLACACIASPGCVWRHSFAETTSSNSPAPRP